MITFNIRAGLYGCIATVGCLGLAAASTAPVTGAAAALPAAPVVGYQPDALPAGAARVSPELLDEEFGPLFGPPPAVSSSASTGTTSPPLATLTLAAPVAATAPRLDVAKQIRCVDGRQTADPLAPPCVDGFAGDNGGATWRGVTAEEVRVVVRLAGGGSEPDPAIAASRRSPTNLYLDLDQPLGPDAPLGAHALKALSNYFNRRFETYGRRVRVIAYFDDYIGYRSIDLSRSLAAELDVRVRPYAVLRGHYGRGVGDNEHDTTLARRDIVVMDARTQLRDFAGLFPGRLWSLRPSVEHQAKLLSSYVCQKVVGRPVVLSGNPGENGGARRLGLVRPADPRLAESTTLARLVRQQVEACGGEFAGEIAFPTEFGVCPLSSTTLIYQQPDSHLEFLEAVQSLRRKGVTTIVWPSCAESRIARAALATGWRPEWIMGGDGAFDRTTVPFQSQFSEVMNRHSVMITPRPYEPPVRKTLCAQAVRETAPYISDFHELHHGCRTYPLLRQLFSAVQVAGPRLTPDHMTAGFADIPPVASTDAQVPTCFYLPGEYSCIKDAQVQWWDAAPQSETSVLLGSTELPAPGCWRAIERGRRYLAGEWPAGNIDAQIRWDEPCAASFSD